MKKFAIYTLVFCLVCMAIFWLWPSQEANAEEEEEFEKEEFLVPMSDEERSALGIKVQKASPAQLNIYVSSRGKVILQPDKVAHIVPKVTGIVREVWKNIGDSVHIGELLAVMESAEMAESKANYLAALQKEKLARSLFEREEKLNQKKISAEADFLHALAQFEQAQIDLQLAQQKLYAYGLADTEIANLTKQKVQDLLFYEIHSPISGEVINRDITKGEYLEGMSSIFEIANLDHVWVEIGLFPKDLSKVKLGQMVQVISPFQDNASSAKLTYISPIIQAETITTKALAELDNSTRDWRPGTLVKTNILTDTINVPLALPIDALQEIEGQNSIFVKTDKGFLMKPVKIGKRDQHLFEIISGIEPEDYCAITETFILKAELGNELAEDDE
jgi:membrane fusion protein, heavy metal efflux system